MIRATQSHRTLNQLALPYRSFCHPLDTTSFFTSGSQDLLISPKGYAERRPGFSTAVETTPTTFNNLQRLFSWSDFSSNFITMAVDLNSSGFAQVYKRVVGVDASFVSIWTSSTAGVFDFVTSNGTVYFSNGTDAKKWNITNGLTNWGIAIGSVNDATGPNGVGTGSNVTFSGASWANPGNITANDGSFATVTLTQGGTITAGPNGFGSQSGAGWSGVGSGTVTFTSSGSGFVFLSPFLSSSNYGFTIPNNATINGIQVSITRESSVASTTEDEFVQLMKVGSGVGTPKVDGIWPTSLTAEGYGSSSDLWGTTWTPADINNTGFGVYLQVNVGASGVTVTITSITITVTYTPAAGAVFSDYLQGTNTSLSIGATNQILGILVEVKGFQSVANSNTQLQVQMLSGGNLVGTVKTGTNLPLSNGFVSFGGQSDLWGTTWTANTINQTNFGVSLQAVSNTAGSVSWSVDFVRITIFSLGGPSISVSGSSGTFSATTGYQYVFCYGNSSSGHISSPSLASASTGSFSSKANVSVTLTASTDPQVNQIRVFRSTDSVAVNALAGAYFELPTSPYSNTNQNITDSTADVNLTTTSVAPTAGYNDPPTPSFGPVYFAGRVWMFKNNKVVFSGLEEIVNGVPEESFPSGPAGNFWTFNEPVTALAVAGTGTNQLLMIFCPGSIYGITGNSLDTFRRFVLTVRRGCRSRTNVSSLDGMVAWVDTSTQLWGTDGPNVIELGEDIRTDLKTINQAATSLTFHTSGEAHWLALSTGSKLFVGDIDLQAWMPPWSFSCNYLGSFEVTLGTYALMAATSMKALQLNQSGTVGTYNDNGSTYQPIANFGLKSLVPDYSVFSAGYAEIANEPSRTGYPTAIQVDTNAVTLGDVLFMLDDDPTNAATVYTSIAENVVTPQVAWLRGQGQNIVQNVFPTNQPTGRWIGVRVVGENADDNLRLYSMFIGYDKR